MNFNLHPNKNHQQIILQPIPSPPRLSLIEALALDPRSFSELLFLRPASSAERSWIKPLMRREALPRLPVGAALKCTFFHSWNGETRCLVATNNWLGGLDLWMMVFGRFCGIEVGWCLRLIHWIENGDWKMGNRSAKKNEPDVLSFGVSYKTE